MDENVKEGFRIVAIALSRLADYFEDVHGIEDLHHNPAQICHNAMEELEQLIEDAE